MYWGDIGGGGEGGRSQVKMKKKKTMKMKKIYIYTHTCFLPSHACIRVNLRKCVNAARVRR